MYWKNGWDVGTSLKSAVPGAGLTWRTYPTIIPASWAPEDGALANRRYEPVKLLTVIPSACRSTACCPPPLAKATPEQIRKGIAQSTGPAPALGWKLQF